MEHFFRNLDEANITTHGYLFKLYGHSFFDPDVEVNEIL